MKIILSRKGIDGGNGGTPSPLIKNSINEWVPVSIPIGGGSEKRRYHEVSIHGYKLYELAKSLGVKGKQGQEINSESRVHFDPDLDPRSIRRNKDWRPMFGQCNAALGHLIKQGVGRGDLFLFLGWFMEANYTDNRASYEENNNPNGVHGFFGWLQVEEFWDVANNPMTKAMKEYPSWAWEHPHFRDGGDCGYGRIYIATKKLAVGDKTYDLPGAGVFWRFTEKTQLTRNGEKRSIWKLPDFFHNTRESFLSYHGNAERWEHQENSWRLESVARGQEFVFDTNKLNPTERKAAWHWAIDLIQEHA